VRYLHRAAKTADELRDLERRRMTEALEACGGVQKSRRADRHALAHVSYEVEAVRARPPRPLGPAPRLAAHQRWPFQAVAALGCATHRPLAVFEHTSVPRDGG
jgi:hypothetical protein